MINTFDCSNHCHNEVSTWINFGGMSNSIVNFLASNNFFHASKYNLTGHEVRDFVKDVERWVKHEVPTFKSLAISNLKYWKLHTKHRSPEEPHSSSWRHQWLVPRARSWPTELQKICCTYMKPNRPKGGVWRMVDFLRLRYEDNVNNLKMDNEMKQYSPTAKSSLMYRHEMT